jgi:hypothetical protein
MFQKLKSRKLWAFIGTVSIVLLNFVFKLGMPPEDVLYLVIASSSYILGQGFVDAKQQVGGILPSVDLANSVTNIIQAEIAKTGIGKNLPTEEILTMFKEIITQELAKINMFTISPVVSTPASVATPDPATVVDPV